MLAEELVRARVVPVIVIDDADRAPDLIAALAAGGIRCAEITLRTPAGLSAISAVAGTPDFAVGAGTVLTAADVDRCADAGATFVVSPGFDDDVVSRALDRGLLPLPGTATATEIQRALRSGVEIVKFFPADRLGGLETIRALAAPFADVRFVPSGGVSPDNARGYLEDPAVAAVSGSWMARRESIAAGDFDGIRLASAECMAALA